MRRRKNIAILAFFYFSFPNGMDALLKNFETLNVGISFQGNDDDKAARWDVVVRLHTALFNPWRLGTLCAKTFVRGTVFLESVWQSFLFAGHLVHDLFQFVNEPAERITALECIVAEARALQVVVEIAPARTTWQDVAKRLHKLRVVLLVELCRVGWVVEGDDAEEMPCSRPPDFRGKPIAAVELEAFGRLLLRLYFGASLHC